MKATIFFWGAIAALSIFPLDGLSQINYRGVPLPNPPHAAVFPALGDPQVIHETNGTLLTLLGTTYGQNHMAPGFENLRTANWIHTPSNALVVWIKKEYPPGGRDDSDFMLVSDRGNTGCVEIENGQGSFVSSNSMLKSFILTAYPRWDEETILRIKPYMGKASKEYFVMENPAPVLTQNWKPEGLPAIKSDGDLTVTLLDLTPGVPIPHRKDASLDTNDPANHCVHFHFSATQHGLPATNWQAWPVRISDPVGNWARGLVYEYYTNGLIPMFSHFQPYRRLSASDFLSDGYSFTPSLWTNHPWKVQLEFICRSNFSAEETVSLTNLPVVPGTRVDWEQEWSAWDVGKTNFPFSVVLAQISGVHLKILPPLQTPSESGSGESSVRVIIGADSDFNPHGMNMTVVSVTDEQGHDLWHPFGSGWAGHYDLEFPVRRKVTALNLKLALHKSRFVEFTLQPGKP